MTALLDTQAQFRAAITGTARAALLSGLRAPASTVDRLDIYRRHHRESFRRHLRGRYPTVEWLLGTDRLVELADLTLRRAPSGSPSMAEYGAELIAVVREGDTDIPPYVADVAQIDWTLGSLSVSIAQQALPIACLAVIDPSRLSRLRFSLQPGLAFIRSDWPVDDLFHLRLADRTPESFTFDPRVTALQLRGARGEFSLSRLSPGAFAFRSSLALGETLADAATRGAVAEAEFDLSRALADLFAEGLVIHSSGDDRHV
jgi:hypothetical protein